MGGTWCSNCRDRRYMLGNARLRYKALMPSHNLERLQRGQPGGDEDVEIRGGYDAAGEPELSPVRPIRLFEDDAMRTPDDFSVPAITQPTPSTSRSTPRYPGRARQTGKK